MSHLLKLISLVFIYSYSNAFASSRQSIKFKIKYPSQLDSIQVDLFKCYLSKITFASDSFLPTGASNSNFYLLDFSDTNLIELNIESPVNIEAKYLLFSLGIDSVANTSGALSGPLDPSNGMYWTWQSGYINFKLEGVSPKSHSKNSEFQFHAGGYAFPFNSMQNISLAIDFSKPIQIEIDLLDFFDQIALAQLDHMMSPGKNAVLMSKTLANCFKIYKNEN